MRVTVADIAAAGGYERWHEQATRAANSHPVKSPVSGGGKAQNGGKCGQTPKNAATGQKSGKTHLSEHDEQALVIARAEALAPSVPALRLLFAVPNGGHRHKATAGKLKAEGVRKGVPDMCLPVAYGGFHGLYIELKAQGGRASDEQREWIAALQAQGYRAEVCVGAEAAWRVICEYLGIGGGEG